ARDGRPASIQQGEVLIPCNRPVFTKTKCNYDRQQLVGQRPSRSADVTQPSLTAAAQLAQRNPQVDHASAGYPSASSPARAKAWTSPTSRHTPFPAQSSNASLRVVRLCARLSRASIASI